MELEFLENIQVELEFHNFFFFFKFSFRSNSIVQKSSFTLKLNFLKIKFQNKGISLNSFRKEAFCWRVCEQGEKPHFSPYI